MNKRLKNMEYLLNFGSTILAVSLIFIIVNLGGTSNLVKFILGTISSFTLMGIGYVVQDKLKLEGSAKVFHFEGIISFLFFYLLAGGNDVFGTWFSTYGDGSNLFYAVLYLLITLLFILTHVRFKNYSFIKMSYISTIISIYNLFIFLSLSYLEITLLLVTVLIFLILFVKDDKKNKFYKNLLSVFVVYLLMLLNDSNENLLLCSVGTLLEVISIILIAIKSKDDESKYFSLIMYYYLMLSIVDIFDKVIDYKILLVLVAFFTCAVDLVINYFIKYFGSSALKWNKFISSIFMFILAAEASDMSCGLFVTVTTLMLLSSIGIVILFKGDTFEKYVFPLKIGLFLFSILYLINAYLFVIPSLVYIFILNLLYLLFYLRSKDNKLKTEYTIIAIILMVSGLLTGAESTLINFLATLFMMLLDYIVLIINSEKDSTDLGKALYIVLLVASLISLGSYDIGSVKYLIETIFLLILFISNDKIKLNVGITIPLICFNLCGYVSEVVTSDILGPILNNLIVLTSICLFAQYIFEGDKRDKFTAVLFALVMLSFIFSIYDMLLSIYAISIIVVVIITAFKFNYRATYISGIVLGIISLLLLINSIEGISASIYLLILGFGVVGFAVYMISKYNKEESKVEIKDVEVKSDEIKEEVLENVQKDVEINKDIYCKDCGNKVGDGDIFCSKCGKKIVD